ncbi:30S ribosomal protein S9 [bacterium]|nr:30S ribosomal protein S9 [bacterium]
MVDAKQPKPTKSNRVPAKSTATKAVSSKPTEDPKKQPKSNKSGLAKLAPSSPSKSLGSRLAIPSGAAYGTGKRKTAVARVWVFPGSGQVNVNGVDAGTYFPTAFQPKVVGQPFATLGASSRFDTVAFVTGGGLMAQADAVRHGVSRALLLVSDDNRPALKSAGLLTRDPRIKERKKYGRKRARKGFQFRKR